MGRRLTAGHTLDVLDIGFGDGHGARLAVGRIDMRTGPIGIFQIGFNITQMNIHGPSGGTVFFDTGTDHLTAELVGQHTVFDAQVFDGGTMSFNLQHHLTIREPMFEQKIIGAARRGLDRIGMMKLIRCSVAATGRIFSRCLCLDSLMMDVGDTGAHDFDVVIARAQLDAVMSGAVDIGAVDLDVARIFKVQRCRIDAVAAALAGWHRAGFRRIGVEGMIKVNIAATIHPHHDIDKFDADKGNVAAAEYVEVRVVPSVFQALDLHPAV